MHWPLEALCAAVTAQCPDFSAQVLAQIDSTNSELMRRVRAHSLMGPTLLVAEEQSAGRGRLGRTWHASADASLTFSVAYPLAKADCSGLSLAVGVSMAESLDPANHHIRLKWPNDLWIHERKLAGTLIETAGAGAQRYAVVGVGINICPCAAISDQRALAPAYLNEVQTDTGPGSALLQLVPSLLQTLQTFALSGFAPFQARFAARDALAQRYVYLSDGQEGLACGVGADGALQVRTRAGMQSIVGAEVSVRTRQFVGINEILPP